MTAYAPTDSDPNQSDLHTTEPYAASTGCSKPVHPDKSRIHLVGGAQHIHTFEAKDKSIVMV